MSDHLDAPERVDVPFLRMVLEASESPSGHRVFVYSGDVLVGQIPAMRADVDARPGELALLTVAVRISEHAQVRSVASSARAARDGHR